jgi:tryptophan-rich sensory protein
MTNFYLIVFTISFYKKSVELGQSWRPILEKKNKILTWVVFYLCVTVASSAGFVFPLGEDNPWYISLIEPSFAPPSWVFAPVWTILYLLIATSAYRIVTKTVHNKNSLLPLAGCFMELTTCS